MFYPLLGEHMSVVKIEHVDVNEGIGWQKVGVTSAKGE